jgi:DUF4097 and DUF4098 domain-containing protein YvlB
VIQRRDLVEIREDLVFQSRLGFLVRVFKTLSGDVELGVPGRPDATLRGSTFSGRLVSDFPTSQGDRRRRNRFSATWGSGSASIEVESFSGDVRIRSSR